MFAAPIEFVWLKILLPPTPTPATSLQRSLRAGPVCSCRRSWHSLYHDTDSVTGMIFKMFQSLLSPELSISIISFKVTNHYRAFSHNVTAAMLVFQNKETAAMMVYQTNPPGINSIFMQILSFVSVI